MLISTVGRRGLTLVELLVAMAILGVALGLVSSASVRQQQLFADLSDDAALNAQIRESAAALPIELRSASPVGGDIRDARDTSLEIRGTIATAVVCDTSAGALVLAPSVAGAGTKASFLTPVVAGDTAWVGMTQDSIPWRSYIISKVGTTPGGACGALGPRLGASEVVVARTTLTLAAMPPAAVGAVVRVTRPLRYSIYRASDGLWYVGEKDWSTSGAKFNTIQPVAGPFSAPSLGGLVFRYADSVGAPITSPVANRAAIATVRLDLRGQTKSDVRVFKVRDTNNTRADSASVAVLLRNRR